MVWYKAQLKPLSGFSTGLQSDTLWGHLAITCLKQRDLFKTLLERTRNGEPPFLVSAAFPSGFLPIPSLVPSEVMGGAKAISDLRKARDAAKRLRSRQYMRLDLFASINRDGWSPERLLEEFIANERAFPKQTEHSHGVMHTAVNRLSGTALTGHLYERGEIVHKGLLDVYFSVHDAEWLPRINEALAELSKTGYGAKLSSGKGRFALVTALEEVRHELFTDLGTAGRFMSLSSFVPQPDQVSDWQARRTIVKRGKLGSLVADKRAGEAAAKPWKKPVFMLAPGTVYHPNEGVRFVGQGIGALADALPKAVQFAYALGISVTMA